MHEYADDDFSTPESLLQETVSFARTILSDLQNANIIVGDQWNPMISLVGVLCATDPADDDFHKEYSPHETIVRRESYAASHPVVVDSFWLLIKRLMEGAGFRNVRDDPKFKGAVGLNGHADFKEGDYSEIASSGTLEIKSICISCVTLPHNLRRALTVDDAELEKLCLLNLQECLAKRAKLMRQEEVRKITKIAMKKTKPGFDPKLN